ncbi:ethanolamine utilization protein EutQ [Pseudonocardia thermophila]|uniref:Ethanolamine utilization protein EutQ n=1 Tax=Pseudonocardia thermophila TaxID=1848 RepID=A0A1M7B172_PSETH|nr:cupin [Pseudonocardia thermophila]SHL48409.1 ethanolamine utilization protein EutQ [Pseudonocardia thermophila]
MGAGVRKVTSDDELEWYRRGTQELRLADAIGEADGAAMTVGFARYAAGEANDWTMSYDEALIVTKGRFAVDGPEGTVEAAAGEVIYLSAGTPLVYRAVEDSELVYVSHPHWYRATLESPHAARLEEFALESRPA